MSEGLKCCPHCGNTQIDYWEEADGFFYCEPCGLCGPRAKDRTEAAKKWNALPRRENKSNKFKIYSALEPCHFTANNNAITKIMPHVR